MEQIIKQNRETLSKVPNFVTKFDYEMSPDVYGLPRHVCHLIDKKINNEITYVDLLTFLSKFLNKNEINYLEIGVSVLKTFFQMSNFFKNSSLYAYDINQINPTIEKYFDKNNDYNLANTTNYTYNTNNIYYFNGDVFNIDQLNLFQNNVLNNKLDIIFSDAHHSFKGLMSEYDNLLINVLNDNFILYYDDLQTHLPRNRNDDMTDAFYIIGKKIKEKYNNVTVAILQVNGWLGNHEHKHTNGIITTLNLKEIFTDNKLEIQVKFMDL